MSNDSDARRKREQITVTIEPPLRAALAEKARAEGRTLSNAARVLIADALTRPERLRA
jgi:hypothetical protein